MDFACLLPHFPPFINILSESTSSSMPLNFPFKLDSAVWTLHNFKGLLPTLKKQHNNINSEKMSPKLYRRFMNVSYKSLKNQLGRPRQSRNLFHTHTCQFKTLLSILWYFLNSNCIFTADRLPNCQYCVYMLWDKSIADKMVFKQFRADDDSRASGLQYTEMSSC